MGGPAKAESLRREVTRADQAVKNRGEPVKKKRKTLG